MKKNLIFLSFALSITAMNLLASVAPVSRPGYMERLDFFSAPQNASSSPNSRSCTTRFMTNAKAFANGAIQLCSSLVPRRSERYFRATADQLAAIIAGWPNLKTLNLVGWPGSAAGIVTALESNPGVLLALEVLDLTNTGAATDQVAAIRARLPRCNVIVN